MLELNIWKCFISDTSQTDLNVFVNGSFVDSKYLKSEESAFNGKKVELVPMFNLKAGIIYQYKKRDNNSLRAC